MARLALISDTHLPDRLAALPNAVFELLDGCDLVLHAGDVGELSVLDELAAIAPVVAVRGNDGGTDSAAVLPLEQLITAGGARLLLWHGHFEDRSDELAWRHVAGWEDIFDRIARRANARGASVVVTGHTHIPLAVAHRGVLLINPGALASGNVFLKQNLRSVAILEVAAARTPEVTHLDVDTGQPFAFEFEASASFDEVAARVQASLLSPELLALDAPDVKRRLGRFYRTDPAFRSAWLDLAHRIWRGSKRELTAADVLGALVAGGPEARAYAELAFGNPAAEALAAP